jgi:diacylglycerol kinase family enzyme
MRSEGHAALPAIAIVPCGSGNTVAFSLGIATLEDVLSAALSGQRRAMDLVELTHPDDRDAPRLQPAASGAPLRGASAGSLASLRQRVQYSCNMVGWGLSSAVLATADNMRWLGAAQYNCAAYSQVRRLLLRAARRVCARRKGRSCGIV